MIKKEILDQILLQIDVLADGTLLKKSTGEVQNQTVMTNGYKHINLKIDGKWTKFYVHRLVASVYCPNPEGKLCVDHIDSNPANNAASNLRWTTPAENSRYAAEAGLINGKLKSALKHDSGRDRWVRISITADQCHQMIELYGKIKSVKTVAKVFGIGRNLTTAIVRDGYVPKCVPPEPDGMKFCCSCNAMKLYAAFAKSSNRLYGLQSCCRDCIAAFYKVRKAT